MSQYQSPFTDPDYKMWIQSLNDISIYDVLDAFDIERSGDDILCPNPDHHDNHFGSCKIHNNRYYCFACHTGGNNISLIMNHERVKFMKAAEILADRMRFPIQKPNGTIERNDSRPKMPITKEQLGFLGLQAMPNRVFLPDVFDIEKPQDKEYRGDIFGYMTGSTVSVSIEQLFYDDPEAFYGIIAGKFWESSRAYLAMYESKIWEWGIFNEDSGRIVQTTLEKALSSLNDLATKLTENRIMDLSYFKMPVVQKKKKRFSLTI